MIFKYNNNSLIRLYMHISVIIITNDNVIMTRYYCLHINNKRVNLPQ